MSPFSQSFADEIIVVDMHSMTIVPQWLPAMVPKSLPTKNVLCRAARNFGLSRHPANGSCFLILTCIKQRIKDRTTKNYQRENIDYVRYPQKYYFGKWIRHSNFWPDYLIRFSKKFGHWKKKFTLSPKHQAIASPF
jgi:hypothetical protein